MKGQQLPGLHLVLVILGNTIGWAEGMTYDPDIIEKYAAFKNRYSISFDNVTEDAYRLEVFHKNVMLIEETNKRNLSYTLEVNKFAAMAQEEFTRKMFPSNLVPMGCVDNSRKNEHYTMNISLGDYPLYLNWVEKGAVNYPVDQGKCNSCYAITALGALEAACWAKTGSLPRLSVQQIIDCSQEEGNFGCVKGRLHWTLNYIIGDGIASDEDYPYKGKDQQCNDKIISDKTKQYLKPRDLPVDSAIQVQPYDLGSLFVQLQKGPIAVAVDARRPEWRAYKGGILESFPCQDVPNHVVLLVGYGVENGKSYWIIRNSWGTGWGEGGYARIIRDPNVKQGTGFCNIMLLSAIRIQFSDPMSPGACRKGGYGSR